MRVVRPVLAKAGACLVKSLKRRTSQGFEPRPTLELCCTNCRKAGVMFTAPMCAAPELDSNQRHSD